MDKAKEIISNLRESQAVVVEVFDAAGHSKVRVCDTLLTVLLSLSLAGPGGFVQTVQVTGSQHSCHAL